MDNEKISKLTELAKECILEHKVRRFAEYIRFVRQHIPYFYWKELKPYLKSVWDMLALGEFTDYHLEEVDWAEAIRLWESFDEAYVEDFYSAFDSVRNNIEEMLEDCSFSCDEFDGGWPDSLEDALTDAIARTQRALSSEWKKEEAFKKLEEDLGKLIKYCGEIRKTIQKGKNPLGKGSEAVAKTIAKTIIEQRECESAFSDFLDSKLDHYYDLIEEDLPEGEEIDEEENEKNPRKISLYFGDCWEGMQDYMDTIDFVDDIFLENDEFCNVFEKMFRRVISDSKYFQYEES